VTRLAVLRHGETNWSRDKRIQGRTDIALAAATRDALSRLRLPASLHVEQVWTSPLLRCTETATLLGWPDARREERLVEMRWGEWEGQRIEALRATFGPAMQENERRGLDFRPPGGESPREVMVRLRSWLAEIATAGVPALAVSHRGVIRALLAAACHWDMLGKPPVRLQWDALHCFELAADGTPTLQQANVALELRSTPPAA